MLTGKGTMCPAVQPPLLVAQRGWRDDDSLLRRIPIKQVYQPRGFGPTRADYRVPMAVRSKSPLIGTVPPRPASFYISLPIGGFKNPVTFPILRERNRALIRACTRTVSETNVEWLRESSRKRVN